MPIMNDIGITILIGDTFIIIYWNANLSINIKPVAPIIPRIMRTFTDVSFGLKGKNLLHKKHPLINPKEYP